ncbi:GGDEF domain-containing protein [bacterium]|nr:GGDEF domain-containing protein [bacterium]
MDEIKELKRQLKKYQIFEEMLDALSRSNELSLQSRTQTTCRVLSLLASPLINIPHVSFLLFHPDQLALQCFDIRLIGSEFGILNTLFVNNHFHNNLIGSLKPYYTKPTLKEAGFFTETNHDFWKVKSLDVFIPLKLEHRFLGFVGLGKDDASISEGEIKFLIAFVSPIALYLGSVAEHEDSKIDPLTGLMTDTYFLKSKQELFEKIRSDEHTDGLFLILCRINNLDRLKEQYEDEIINALILDFCALLNLLTGNSNAVTRFNQTQFLIIPSNTSLRSVFLLIESVRRQAKDLLLGITSDPIELNLLFSFYKYSGEELSFFDILNTLQAELGNLQARNNTVYLAAGNRVHSNS